MRRKLAKGLIILGIIALTTLILCSFIFGPRKQRTISESVNEQKKSIWLDRGDDKSEYEVIVIDSCEYIYIYGYSRVGITHKGNCKFCEERRRRDKNNINN